jgi:hypothetical protein
MANVVMQNLIANALQRRLHGGDLGEQINAEARFCNHTFKSPHLALDSAQAKSQGFLGVNI